MVRLLQGWSVPSDKPRLLLCMPGPVPAPIYSSSGAGAIPLHSKGWTGKVLIGCVAEHISSWMGAVLLFTTQTILSTQGCLVHDAHTSSVTPGWEDTRGHPEEGSTWAVCSSVLAREGACPCLGVQENTSRRVSSGEIRGALSRVIFSASLREESSLNMQWEARGWVGCAVFEEGLCSPEKPADFTPTAFIDWLCFLQVIKLFWSLGHWRQHVTSIQPWIFPDRVFVHLEPAAQPGTEEQCCKRLSFHPDSRYKCGP